MSSAINNKGLYWQYANTEAQIYALPAQRRHPRQCFDAAVAARIAGIHIAREILRVPMTATWDFAAVCSDCSNIEFGEACVVQRNESEARARNTDFASLCVRSPQANAHICPHGADQGCRSGEEARFLRLDRKPCSF